ncbi:MAG: hypothetical protein WAN74_06790 [Thermoplasmata archaeon]
MVALSLTIAGALGIVLTGGYLWWEMGRYTTPQVVESRFDERRMIFAYTLGLFVGVLLSLPWLLYLAAMTNAALLGAFALLFVLVLAIELAEWVVRRTHYWGKGPSFPFYAIGLRAGIGAILVLALVGQYLSAPTITWDGTSVVGLQAVAIVALEVTGALVSLPATASGIPRQGIGVLSGALISGIGLFLLGFNAFGGEIVGGVAAGIVLIGSIFLYRRARVILDRIPPPSLVGAPPPVPPGGRYGRQDREPPAR